MYHVKWKKNSHRVFLPLNTLLKMLEIEGLTYNDVEQMLATKKAIHISKAIQMACYDEEEGKDSLYTSDYSEIYLDETDIYMIEVNLEA
jgi:hypothetical protein